MCMFVQENAHFWKQKRVWMWLGNEKYLFSCKKNTFLTAHVAGNKSVQMHWKLEIFIFLYENAYFWKQKPCGIATQRVVWCLPSLIENRER